MLPVMITGSFIMRILYCFCMLFYFLLRERSAVSYLTVKI